jgi:hypothetical protein
VSVSELLRNPPLGRDLVWLADQIIAAIQHGESVVVEAPIGPAEERALVIQAGTEETMVTDRGPLRLFRPLLACIANVCATETGMEFQPYGGCYTLYRAARGCRVRLDIRTENTPGRQRLEIRRTETARGD